MATYCSVQDIRNFTNVQSPEYSDAQLLTLASGATAIIDQRTGRTWQASASTSGWEYYDGDGSSKLFLNNTDVISLTGLGIDDDDDQTYTSITTSKVDVYPEGILHLQSDAEITAFTDGYRTVRAAYTYGNSSVPDKIRHLSLLMVSDMLDPVPEKRAEIDELIKSNLAIGAIRV